MQVTEGSKDYELLDMSGKEKLERWGDFLLIRPDPQVIWSKKLKPDLWKKADARYIRSNTGGGHWETYKKLPDSWKVSFGDLKFNVKPMGFKHTGLFPEQAVNWEYMMDKIKGSGREIKVLNLFAYTGGATVACLKAGATVCHVDSSKGMVSWAKENVASSGLEKAPVRFIVDDTIKFVERELRRGNRYDCIIMDPPSYGRGAAGEIWSIEEDLEKLVKLCSRILSDNPILYIINTYTGGYSKTIISNLLNIALSEERPELMKIGQVVSNEIGIKVKGEDLALPCGYTTKWEKS